MDILNRIERVEAVTRCGNHYHSVVRSLANQERISPITLEIINKISPDQRLWACLLALTLHRFEEIHTTNWTTWAGGKSQAVFMPKVSAYKELPGLTLELSQLRTHPDPTPHVACLKYRSLARAIKRVLPRAVLKVLTDNKIYTHVFRHVETSYHLHLKREPREIRSRLGHQSPITLLAYEHKNLFIDSTP